jgi:hypothetical protein
MARRDARTSSAGRTSCSLTSEASDYSAEVGALKELIDYTSPPFYARSSSSGVDTVSIRGLETTQANNIADRCFQNQATVVLFRQWVSQRNGMPTNEFIYRFDWKPAISAEDVANLKGSFRAMFGVDIDAIPRLT